MVLRFRVANLQPGKQLPHVRLRGRLHGAGGTIMSNSTHSSQGVHNPGSWGPASRQACRGRSASIASPLSAACGNARRAPKPLPAWRPPRCDKARAGCADRGGGARAGERPGVDERRMKKQEHVGSVDFLEAALFRIYEEYALFWTASLLYSPTKRA
jgi:hypothetical protein